MSHEHEQETRAGLEALRALAEERLAAARRADWEALARLEARRRELLAALRPDGLAALAAGDPERAAALRAELLERDRLVECALRAALGARGEAAVALETRRRAEAGYRKGSQGSP